MKKIICFKLWQRATVSAVTFVSLLQASSCWASTGVQDVAETVAQRISQLRDPQRLTEIVVGSFTNQFNSNHPGGAAIRQAVRQELIDSGVQVVDRADYSVYGEFVETEEGVHVNYFVKTSKGQTLIDGSKEGKGPIIDKPEDVALVTGSTVPNELPFTDQVLEKITELASSDAEAQRMVDEPNRTLKLILEKDPSFFARIKDSAIWLSEGGFENFGLAVERIGPSGEASPLNVTRRDNGFLFVDLARGDRYQIKLINAQGDAVFVKLFVDGVNVFATRTDGGDKDSPWRLGESTFDADAGMKPFRGLVKGWYKNSRQAAEFKILEMTDEDIKKIFPNVTDAGAITLHCFNLIDPNEVQPRQRIVQHTFKANGRTIQYPVQTFEYATTDGGALGSAQPGSAAPGSGKSLVTDQDGRIIDQETTSVQENRKPKYVGSITIRYGN